MSATNFSSAKALKKLFTVSTFMLLTAIGTSAHAYSLYPSTCYEDWVGNWVCKYGNGGYTTTTREDWVGNDVTTDNYGNSISCHFDWVGNYVCN